MAGLAPSHAIAYAQTLRGQAAYNIEQHEKMRFAIALLFIAISTSVRGQNWVNGDIQYSVATYSDEVFVDKKYGRFLDSLLRRPVFEYFRGNYIRDLPSKDKDKRKGTTPSERHVIEPLFINLTTFNGVYAKRIWELDLTARRPTRFRCGFHHRLFIISNNKYVELSADTIKNEKLIATLLTSDFSNEEISRMTEYFRHEIICEHFTFLPSFYIKREGEVLFDAETIKKSN